MMLKIRFTLILIFGLHLLGFSQPFTISGKVVDDFDQPIIGAGVFEKGTTIGTVTDLDGRFVLQVKDSLTTLVVTYMGYENAEHRVDAKKKDQVISVGKSEVVLDEVVVTGYGRERRSSIKRSKTILATPGFAPASPPPAPPPPPATAYMTAPRRDAAVMRAESVTLRGVASSGGYAMAADVNAIAGTLTAGEIHDFSKWDLWQDVAAEDLMNWREYWRIYPSQRYPLQLTNREGRAVVNATVKLLDQDRNVVWETRTDNTGKAELWDDLFTARKGPNRQLRMLVEYEGQQFPLEQISSFQQGYNFMSIPVACENKNAVDIVFVVDATGSMRDEIDYLKAELADVIQRVKDTLPDADLSLGSVFYRDQGEEYITRKTPLSSAISRTTDFIQKQEAQGGGDHPEAVEAALKVAVEEMEWRSNAGTRLMFVVLDAPPHQSPEILATLESVTRLAAAKGIRIVPIACSGIDKSTEYLMRSLALATNGTYTFLTDDSGVGYSHIEPTTDSYDVEKLNGLLARVIYQFAYTRDCNEAPVIALNNPVDTGMVVAQVELPEDKKPDHPELSLRFYPNPSSGPVNVEANGIGELFLADFSGKILERFTIADSRSTIDIGRYPAGTYHLRFRTEDDQWLGDELVLTR
ncbi:carboxypeptidase-like regulatory domain-containing protein [Flavilitoribacter nigricans]|uniref:VWFA domain-containing protein n=1 Tax=Flavilitoribacter nigricans (strain ATCC 23147 / DSM 23189 / NBRC 102662 / NCIMB 1420 / SS-2) TaxID=1122177 RepID=A0A2D0N912_FLAN2|nr:carboxypeptidase-like regulatory domain-containing protein [Flavilitoribacter nigricans]PHN04866.1 hypothetical protein CRP01_20380 [Flavilitoribacter nigricans DSM 23189 = NBRC 102662]